MTGSSDDPTPTLTVKLLVDKSANKVLFAEASKPFVDFLFSLLAVPVGTAVQLLTAPDMIGSVANIYSSLEYLRSDYLQPRVKKEVLLNPKIDAGVIQAAGALPLPSQPPAEAPIPKRYYGCNNISSVDVYGRIISQVSICSKYFTETADTACPECKSKMDRELESVPGKVYPVDAVPVAPGGYVQALVTYMVMDDLSVSPMSSISCITLLNKFHVKDLGSLEERVVSIGRDEGLMLFGASLRSTTVLSDVFLAKKPPTVLITEEE